MKNLDNKVLKCVLCVCVILMFWIGANHFRYRSFGYQNVMIHDTWTGKVQRFNLKMFE